MEDRIGIMVWDVCDVLYPALSSIIGYPKETFVAGTFRHEEKMVSILDLAKILDEEGLIVNQEV